MPDYPEPTFTDVMGSFVDRFGADQLPPTPLAVVTGAASGSGLAITHKLIEQDMQVIGIDVQEQPLKELAAQLPGFTPITCDLRDLDAVLDLCEQIPGSVDIRGADDETNTLVEHPVIAGAAYASVLINCAGRLRPGVSAGYPGQRYIGTINAMLTAPALLASMALPAMHANGHGAVVNIGSFYSIWGGAGKNAYLAAKWGLVGMTKGMGLESAALTGTGVRHVCICPPHVNSPLFNPHQIRDESAHQGKTPDQRYAQLVAQMPTHELADPEDVAEVVGWWLTSPAARHITACTLDMSGGITAGFPYETAGW